MKMIIATDNAGRLVGAVHGHSLSEKKGDVEVSVSFGPTHVLHQVEVDDDMAGISDATEFQRRLQHYIPTN